jgi:hypothetical protein
MDRILPDDAVLNRVGENTAEQTCGTRRSSGTTANDAATFLRLDADFGFPRHDIADETVDV